MGIELDLPRLRCFAVVAEELSFTRAAERLRLAQPWVSSQIRRLERDVGMSLFTRSTRHVELTPAGRLLLPHVTLLLSAAERSTAAVESLRRAERGELRLGSPAHLAMTVRYPQLARVIRRWGSAVRIHNAPSVDLLPALKRGELDAAFLADPQPGDDIVTHIVEEGALVMLVPEDHVFAVHEDVIPLTALEGQQVMTFGSHHNERLWNDVVAPLAEVGVDFVEANEPAAWIMFQSAHTEGLPSLMHPWIAEQLQRSGGSVVRRIEGEPCRYTTIFACREVEPFPMLAALWACVRELSNEAAAGGGSQTN